MFERVAQSEEEKDAEARIGRSDDQIASLRLAAWLLLVNAFATAAVVILLKGNLPIVSILIALGLAFYLFKLRPRAEALALGLTILGGIIVALQAVAGFTRSGASLASAVGTALFDSIPGLAVTVALLLLLIGNPGRPRRVAAVVLYAVFTLGFYALLVVASLLGSSETTGL